MRVALYLQDSHDLRDGLDFVRYAEERGFEIHPVRSHVRHMLEEPGIRLLDQHSAKQRHPSPDMVLDELLLGIDDDLSLFSAVMTTRVGFFVGQKVHELEFNA